MQKVENWNFNYRGIICEISHHGVSEYRPNGIYCAYISLTKENLPVSFSKLLCKEAPKNKYTRSKRRYWNYYHLNQYFDMHGGLTYYGKIRNEFSGKVVAVKVGCDYAHAGDEDMGYDEKDLKRDLEKYVDVLYSHFKDELVVWDIEDGKYRKWEDTSWNKTPSTPKGTL